MPAIDLTGYNLQFSPDGTVIKCTPPAPAPVADRFAVIGQRDPRWASRLMGNSRVSTLGRYGCLVTCDAIMAGTTPDKMNEELARNGGFQPEPKGAFMAWAGFSGALNAASKQLGREVRFSFISDKMNYGQPRPSWWADKLLDWLNVRRQPAVLDVDSNIKTTLQDQHFVLALPGTGRDITIIDPWDMELINGQWVYGRKQSLLPEYGASIDDAVWRYILYEVKDGPNKS